MRTIVYIILFFAILLASFGAIAQTTVETKVDTRQITIGDQVRYFIEVKKDRKEQIVWANIPDSFNTLEVVEKGEIDTLNTDGNTIFRQRLLITGFDSGLFQIPAFEFTAIAHKSSKVIYTDSFDLSVQTIPVDTTKPFRGIKEIKEVELTWYDYMFAGISVWPIMLLLTFVVMIIYTLWRRKNKKPYVPPGPPESPHERAVRLLAELDEKELWQKDNVKQYYVELTDILRYYIEGRFGITVLELTTDELLDKMKTHVELTNHRAIIGSALQIADMAKFAKAQPLPEEHIDAYNKISQFVAITQPVEESTQNTKKK